MQKEINWYQSAGVDEVHTVHTRKYTKGQVNSLSIEEEIDPVMAARRIADECTNLEQLKKAVFDCELCPLKLSATNTVFADGNPSAKVMLIGEAPGANEDAMGIPFCGDSGKLLDNVIKSIGLDRTNSYITNSIFWRPPANRRPTEQELAICLPFVEKHIALISPQLIILVGSTASLALFGDLGPVSKQRQRVLKYKNCYLDREIDSVVIFHPSYLMRQPSQKKLAWFDMLFIEKCLAGVL